MPVAADRFLVWHDDREAVLGWLHQDATLMETAVAPDVRLTVAIDREDAFGTMRRSADTFPCQCVTEVVGAARLEDSRPTLAECTVQIGAAPALDQREVEGGGHRKSFLRFLEVKE